MKSYQVAICDEEVDYSFSLMNYINGEEDYPCLAMAFTDYPALKDYCKQEENKIDLILLGSHIQQEVEEVLGSENEIPIVWLHEKQEVDQGAGVYKYQSAETLLQVILEQVKPKQREEENKGDKKQTFMEVYGIYSPIGRCGKTNLAKALCSYQKGKSLYIGMEEYGDTMDEGGIGQEFLYDIKVHSDNLCTFLSNLLEDQMGMTTIASPKCYLDLRQLTEQDIRWFLDQVRSRRTYQRVVFDIGTGSLFDFTILSLFDRIFIPTLEQEVAKQKQQHFLTFINQSFPSIYYKMRLLSVPNVAYDSLKMEEYVLQLLQGVDNG